MCRRSFLDARALEFIFCQAGVPCLRDKGKRCVLALIKWCVRPDANCASRKGGIRGTTALPFLEVQHVRDGVPFYTHGPLNSSFVGLTCLACATLGT